LFCSVLERHETHQAVVAVARILVRVRSTARLLLSALVLVSPLTGESLLPVAAKVTKNACPDIRPCLRQGSFTPSLFQGPAAKGHPWPIAALATSMSLNPFHNDSIHPPEGAFGVVCAFCVVKPKSTANRSLLWFIGGA
jgi:hypothetical protein